MHIFHWDWDCFPMLRPRKKSLSQGVRIDHDKMGLDETKPVFGVSNKARLKPVFY